MAGGSLKKNIETYHFRKILGNIIPGMGQKKILGSTSQIHGRRQIRYIRHAEKLGRAAEKCCGPPLVHTHSSRGNLHRLPWSKSQDGNQTCSDSCTDCQSWKPHVVPSMAWLFLGVASVSPPPVLRRMECPGRRGPPRPGHRCCPSAALWVSSLPGCCCEHQGAKTADIATVAWRKQRTCLRLKGAASLQRKQHPVKDSCHDYIYNYKYIIFGNSPHKVKSLWKRMDHSALARAQGGSNALMQPYE